MTTIPLEPVDAVRITSIVDNVSDMLLLDQGPAKRPSMSGSGADRIPAAFLEGGITADPLKAEHGFSALISIAKGDTKHNVLFDAGISPEGVAENMRRLEFTPKDIEAIVLSHGHFDHTTGMDGIVKALGGTAKLPVLIHPEFWSRRRLAVPGHTPIEIPSSSKSALREAGFEIIEERQPSFLLDGSILMTGEVDRTTDFETGFKIHQAFHNDQWQPDPLVLDDQAVVINVRDKGLVVMTGCGHAGIINIIKYAQKLTGEDKIYAVLGGFHLNGPLFEPIISSVIEALKTFSPEVVMPGHCTGWRATHAIAAAFPSSFIQGSVGTRLEL